MKKQTINLVIDSLSRTTYTTKSVVSHKTKLSHAALENAVEILISEGKIRQIYVKTNVKTGRAEVAYRKIKEIRS